MNTSVTYSLKSKAYAYKHTVEEVMIYISKSLLSKNYITDARQLHQMAIELKAQAELLFNK